MRMNIFGVRNTSRPSPRVARRPDVAVVRVDTGVDERLRFEVDRAAHPADHQLAVADRIASAGQEQPGGRVAVGDEAGVALHPLGRGVERAPVVRDLQLEADRLQRIVRAADARAGAVVVVAARQVFGPPNSCPFFAFVAKRDCTRTSVTGRGAGSRSAPVGGAAATVRGAAALVRGAARRRRPAAARAGVLAPAGPRSLPAAAGPAAATTGRGVAAGADAGGSGALRLTAGVAEAGAGAGAGSAAIAAPAPNVATRTMDSHASAADGNLEAERASEALARAPEAIHPRQLALARRVDEGMLVAVPGADLVVHLDLRIARTCSRRRRPGCSTSPGRWADRPP